MSNVTINYVKEAQRSVRQGMYHLAVLRDDMLTPLEASHAGMALEEVKKSDRLHKAVPELR